MMPATLPEEVVAGILATALGLTIGEGIFSGPEQPKGDVVPDAAVFCIGQPGLVPVPLLGVNQDIRGLGVKILLRGEIDGFDAVRDQAWLAWQSLQRVTNPATGYIDILCTQSAPAYAGQDDFGYPKFYINVILRFQG